MPLTPGGMASSVLDMTINDDQAQSLREAAERVKATKDEYDAAKSNREQLIAAVALDGASYRELADAADLSYQRVHQLLTGEKKPPAMPAGIADAFHCPKCGAKPRHDCKDDKGKRRLTTHIERSHRSHAVIFDNAESRPDEPASLMGLYSAMRMTRIGSSGSFLPQDVGPIYINPDDAAAHARTLGEGAHVACWTGRKWEATGA